MAWTSPAWIAKFFELEYDNKAITYTNIIVDRVSI